MTAAVRIVSTVVFGQVRQMLSHLVETNQMEQTCCNSDAGYATVEKEVTEPWSSKLVKSNHYGVVTP